MGVTCGFDSNGNPRVAAPGFDCRVNSVLGLWAFCPSSVIAASDCGMAGYCVDKNQCTSGCGPLSGRTDITTAVCVSQNYCSTLISDNGLGESYLYIGCGAVQTTDTIFATTPMSVSATTTSASPTSASATSSSSSLPASTSSTSSSASITTMSTSTSSIAVPSPTGSPVAATSVPATEKGSSNASSNIGPIVGGALGGLAMICLTVLAIFLVRRQRSSKQKHLSDPSGGRHEDPPTFSRSMDHYQPSEVYSGPIDYKRRTLGPFEASSSEVNEVSGHGRLVELSGETNPRSPYGYPSKSPSS